MASEGIELNEPEIPNTDPYIESRKQPLRSYVTPSTFDKLKQFIELDRKVLRFYCVWDDRDSMFGEMRPCVSRTLGYTQSSQNGPAAGATSRLLWEFDCLLAISTVILNEVFTTVSENSL